MEKAHIGRFCVGLWIAFGICGIVGRANEIINTDIIENSKLFEGMDGNIDLLKKAALEGRIDVDRIEEMLQYHALVRLLEIKGIVNDRGMSNSQCRLAIIELLNDLSL